MTKQRKVAYWPDADVTELAMVLPQLGAKRSRCCGATDAHS
jgi:hypothetical protein